MAATYDDTLSADRDWIRFLARDTDMSAAEFSDAEIAAALAETRVTGEAKKYAVAADLLGILLARWTTKGKGIEEKQVSKLRIRYGGSSTAAVAEALRARIRELRIEAAQRNNPAPAILKAL